jgi:hypothetical protein
MERAIAEPEAVPQPIAPGEIRYIKLGEGGAWERVSFGRGELHFGHGEIPHELALCGNEETIRQRLAAAGRKGGVARRAAREVLDFYRLGADCLWVTIAEGHLWWTFAEPDVIWLGEGEGHGKRLRKCIGGWHSSDIRGVPLRLERLSGKLTSVASFQGTICRIKAVDYLLRRINGVVEPVVRRYDAARDALLDVLGDAISMLAWTDFETLVDLIFTRSGWNRVSSLGENMKLVDMVLEQPVLAQRAAVQVKSRAGRAEFNDFVSKADATHDFSHLFFVCHSPERELAVPERRQDVHVWSGAELAEMVLRVGLLDWTIDKVG